MFQFPDGHISTEREREALERKGHSVYWWAGGLYHSPDCHQCFKDREKANEGKVCHCGVEAGTQHSEFCPFPLYVDDPETSSKWEADRDILIRRMEPRYFSISDI
jgi:hypothetical protein